MRGRYRRKYESGMPTILNTTEKKSQKLGPNWRSKEGKKLSGEMHFKVLSG